MVLPMRKDAMSIDELLEAEAERVAEQFNEPKPRKIKFEKFEDDIWVTRN